MQVLRLSRPGVDSYWESIPSAGTLPSPFPPWDEQHAPFALGLRSLAENAGRVVCPFGGIIDATYSGQIKYLDGEGTYPYGGIAGSVRSEWNEIAGSLMTRNDGEVYAISIDYALPTTWWQGNGNTSQFRHISQIHNGGSTSPLREWDIVADNDNSLAGTGANPRLRFSGKNSSGNYASPGGHRWSSTDQGTSWNAYGWTNGYLPTEQWFRTLIVARWEYGNSDGWIHIYVDPDPRNDNGQGTGFQLVDSQDNFQSVNSTAERPSPKFGVYGKRVHYYWDNRGIYKKDAGETEAEFVAAIWAAMGSVASPGPGPTPDPEPPPTGVAEIDLRVQNGADDAIVQQDGTGFSSSVAWLSQKVWVNSVPASARNVGLYWDLSADATPVPAGATIFSATIEVLADSLFRDDYRGVAWASDELTPAPMNGTTRRPYSGDLTPTTAQVAFAITSAGITDPAIIDITAVVQELANDGQVDQLLIVLEASTNSAFNGTDGSIADADTNPTSAARLLINWELAVPLGPSRKRMHSQIMRRRRW